MGVVESTLNDKFFNQSWADWALFFILAISVTTFAISVNAWVRRAV